MPTPSPSVPSRRISPRATISPTPRTTAITAIQKGPEPVFSRHLHLHSKGGTSRDNETAALANFIAEKVPKDALILIGGDFNTRSTGESCFKQLARIVVIPEKPPADQHGEISTNAPRNHPYDWVLASPPLNQAAVPVKLADAEFPHGLIFDSRVFEPLEKVPPVQKTDSAVPNMQHMAVIRDFMIP